MRVKNVIKVPLEAAARARGSVSWNKLDLERIIPEDVLARLTLIDVILGVKFLLFQQMAFIITYSGTVSPAVSVHPRRIRLTIDRFYGFGRKGQV
jgi:hypothetical protein